MTNSINYCILLSVDDKSISFYRREGRKGWNQCQYAQSVVFYGTRPLIKSTLVRKVDIYPDISVMRRCLGQSSKDLLSMKKLLKNEFLNLDIFIQT